MDVIKCLRPLHVLTLFMGLASYRETRNNNGLREYNFSFLLFVLTIVIAFFSISWSFYYLKHALTVLEDPITFLCLAFTIKTLCYIVICLLNNILHCHYFNFINRLNSIDDKLQTLYINPNDTRSCFMLLSMTGFEYFVTIGNILMIGFKGNYTALIPNFISQTKDVVFLQFFSSIYLLYYRFKLINDRLSIIKNLYSDSSRDFKLILAIEIRGVCIILDELSVLRIVICKAFQIQVVSSILFLVIYSLVMINEIFHNFVSFSTYSYVMMSVNAARSNFSLFILALACTNCLDQVKHE